MNLLDSTWFYWAVGIAIGLPAGLIVLTELHNILVRRNSHLARQASLLRNYLLPLGAVLLLLVKASEVPAEDPTVRVLTTAFGFLVLVLLLSLLNATLFQGAPQQSWRKRLPAIFVDVARFALIGIGLAVILSYIWGVRVGGLFAAFRIDDWLETPTARGRVVEVNWRAVHIDTGSGLQIMPNSMLATTAFTNLSRPAGAHECSITTTFSTSDPPDKVCAMLNRAASALPHVKPGVVPATIARGAAEYRTTVRLTSPADEGPTQATFLRWVWYAARREGLHLDEADDEFSTAERVESALRTVVGPELRLSSSDQQSLARYARLVRYGTDEIVQHAGVVPMGITFVIAGSVRLTVTTDDGSVVAIATLKKGTFLGLTALTRQPDPAGAVALEEVTALQIGREHLEQVVMNKPMLLQELGRVIDERQRKAQQAIRRDLHQSPAAAGEHRGPARR